MYFFSSRISSRIPHDIESLCLLRLLLAASQTLSFFFMTLTVLRRRLLQNDSQFRAYVFFSWLNCVYDFGRGRQQSQNVIKVTSYQGHLLSPWLIAVNVNFEHRADIVSTGFFTMRSLFFLLPFNVIFIGRKSLSTGHF